MNTNYETVVKTEVDSRLRESAAPIKRSRVFDIIALETAMKTFDVTPEEIESGLVDGEGDGGIDGVYTFVNQKLLTEDSEILSSDFEGDASLRGSSISLWIVQAKEESGFRANAISILNENLGHLLSEDATEEGLRRKGFGDGVVSRLGQFRTAIERLRRFHPTVSVNFRFVTLGDADKPLAPSQVAAIEGFQKRIYGDLGFDEANVAFLGAKDVWRALLDNPVYGAELRVAESFSHEPRADERSYVCLVALRDYVSFITDAAGDIRDHLFDGNVRHHEGSASPVNKEMRASIGDSNAPEFWWLNNGVTVICSNASFRGKIFSLDDVQIVNGLQTSRTLFEAAQSVGIENFSNDRFVLVRIIESADVATVNRVIRATNRQTPVREESLRATDEIQLLIERQLLASKIYYDRRRNYYKNKGEDRNRIVSVRALAQALLAIVVGRPDEARARPGDYLKSDVEYEALFDLHANIHIYEWVIQAMWAIERELKSDESASASERNDSRYLIAADIVRASLGYRPSSEEDVLKLGSVSEVFAKESIAHSLSDLRAAFAREMKGGDLSRDRLSKSGVFAEKFLSRRRRA